jgi:protein TonB
MQRMLPALVFAILIHAIVLTVDSRWLMRQESIAPKAQVITMRLVGRPPSHPPTIRSLPAPPASLPPIPVKQAFKAKPVVKKSKVVAKQPPMEKTAVLPPPEPPAMMTASQLEPEASPPTPMPEAAPTLPDNPLTAATADAPPTNRTTDRISGEKAGTVTAVVKATPRYNHNPPPVYPSLARKRGYQGTAILEVFVEADGRVGDLRIIESSSHKLLDRSAMKAVKGWHFEPGRQGNRTIAMWVRVPVRFALNPDSAR